MDNDDWDDAWDFPFQSLVSIHDRLVQFKIVQRAYFTPHRLLVMNSEDSSECWRCGTSPGDFSHIFWHCPKVQQYWSEVLNLTNRVALPTLPQVMDVCLLGLIETLVPTIAKHTMIVLLLFYARKNIAMQWKKPTSPSLVQWKRLVNDNLPLYKDTYANRGCPLKFDKVWRTWLDELDTAQ